MRPVLRPLLPAALALLALPALAASAPTGSHGGVVVQRDARHGALVLATPSGSFVRVHTDSPRRFRTGSIVRVHGTQVTLLGRVRTATAPSLELHASVLSQTATTLTLSVPGFTAGLTLQDGGVTVPTLAAGTQVEAQATLGPDPANAQSIVLTLVSLHVEDAQAAPQAPAAPAATFAEGAVTAVSEATATATGSLTVAGEGGPVTFTIPAGSGATGVAIGDRVEARGSSATPPVLVSLELSGRGADQGTDANDDHGHDRNDDHGRHGGGSDDGGHGHAGSDD